MGKIQKKIQTFYKKYMDKGHVKENQLVDNDSKKMIVASQNYINDFNHRFIVVHHFSAKF